MLFLEKYEKQAMIRKQRNKNNNPIPKTKGNNQVLTPKTAYRKLIEQLFPNMWPFSYTQKTFKICNLYKH